MVVVKVLTPTGLSKKEKDLFKELKKIEKSKKPGVQKDNPLYN